MRSADFLKYIFQCSYEFLKKKVFVMIQAARSAELFFEVVYLSGIYSDLELSTAHLHCHPKCSMYPLSVSKRLKNQKQMP